MVTLMGQTLSVLASISKKYDDIPVEVAGIDVPKPLLQFASPPLDQVLLILATGRAQSLESSLAEVHHALTEARELEGHLIDLQSKRDELAVELEAMGRENDRLTAQIDAKDKEVTQVQSALATAQELRRQLNAHTEYELSRQQSEAKLQERNDTFRDAKEAVQAARARRSSRTRSP